MKKLITIITITLCVVTSSYSQNYKTAIGVRVGLYNGLTVKHFLGSSTAVEGILSTRWDGFNVTGLFEIINNTEINRLDWYYGVGGHIGFWNGRNVPWAKENKSYTVIGIDGIIGADYTFESVPLNLSLDWKPALNIIGYSGFWSDGFALSVRYAIK